MYEYTRSYAGLGTQEYTRSYDGLGYSYPRGSCSQVNQGESRCFRPREESIAVRVGCRETGSACEVGGATGAAYCCPPGSLATDPSPASSESTTAEGEDRKGVWETVTEWFTETGERITDRPAPAGMTNKGNGDPTADGFAEHARDAAGQAAAQAEMDELPIEDETPLPWFQRYQTHITIASTVIGLGSFVGWLYLREK